MAVQGVTVLPECQSLPGAAVVALGVGGGVLVVGGGVGGAVAMVGTGVAAAHGIKLLRTATTFLAKRVICASAKATSQQQHER